MTTRYYGWYADRPRGMRRQTEPAEAETPPAIVPAPRLAPTEAARRWAAVLQQIFEVDPLACPTCRGPMRIVAFLTQPSVIDQLLTHLRTRAATAAHADARSPPSTRGPSAPGATRRSAAAHRAHYVSPRRPGAPTTTRGDVRCARQSPGASDRFPLRPGAHGKRRPDGQRDAAAGRRARRPAPAGPRVVGDRAVGSMTTRPTPLESPSVPKGVSGTWRRRAAARWVRWCDSSRRTDA